MEMVCKETAMANLYFSPAFVWRELKKNKKNRRYSSFPDINLIPGLPNTKYER